MAQISKRQELEWPLPGNQRLAWHSPSRRGFVIGNHADKSLVTIEPPGVLPLITRADAYAQKNKAYDDQLSPADYGELRTTGLDGFQFLTREQYDAVFPSETWGSTCPVDQALVSGLTGQVPVAMPCGAVVSITDRKITLHDLSAGPIATVADAKLRGPLTAVVAHPSQPVIFYGTNAGDIYSLAVTAGKLGPQKKVAAMGRVVNALRITLDGHRLIAGGMGFVAIFALGGKLPKLTAKLDVSCRSIHVLNDRWLLLNQGMHGLKLCEISDRPLRLDAACQPSTAVDRVICSADGSTALVLFQPPAGIELFDLRL